MLPTPEAVKMIGQSLKEAEIKTLVVDPVLVSTSGDSLASNKVAEAIVQHLLPICAVLCPNIPEVETLLNQSINNVQEMKKAAKQLQSLGPELVLIKGGHLITPGASSVIDVIFDGSEITEIEHPLIQTDRVHGTGCTLASAIASYLAQDYFNKQLDRILKRSTIILLIIFSVLAVDQGSKVLVKTSLQYGKGFKIFGQDWAQIHFVENPGMAFGIRLGEKQGKFDEKKGKLLLSVFRLIAIGFLIFYIRNMIREKSNFLITSCFALILAGAIGNMIDSAFYGLIFSGSSPHSSPAVLFPETGGYASFLHGKVVDMFHFPLYSGYFPDWFPFWGGQSLVFFRPIFNVADVSISVGVIVIILFLFGLLGNGKNASW